MSSDARDSPSPPAVLVVEHDPELGAPLVEQLVADGYSVRLARTAAHARALTRTGRPTAVVLGELEAPAAALELLAEIRGSGAAHGLAGGARLAAGQCSSPAAPVVLSGAPPAVRCDATLVPVLTPVPAATPLPAAAASWPPALAVIVVSSRTGEPDELRAFEAGADDFLARPVPYLRLRARLRALLTRVDRGYGEPPLAVGPLAIDPRARAVLLHGRPVSLRPLEYELLVHLARDPWRVCPRPELLRVVWGGAAGATRTLDSHASRLRRRLRAAGPERWVVGVRGVGYRLL